jgi:uncharacterized protein (DUF58 family)
VSGRPGLARGQAALRHLELTITRRLDGLLQGDHQGLVPGSGSEPGEGRVYQPGDDVRRIDWNLTARTTVAHVRETIADRELETWVVVDQSASLDFGTAACEKRDLALAATAAVGFLTARAGNRLGALLLRPEGLVTVPPRSGRDAIMALLQRLATTPRASTPRPSTARTAGAGATANGGAHDLSSALRTVGPLARRRGLVVVISDFLDPAGWERPLRSVRGRHEVLAVEVLDPRELELPPVGLLTLVDPETGRRIEVQTARSRVRERYAEAATGQRAEIARALRGAAVPHLTLRTDRDWLLDIVRFVATRRRLRTGLVAPQAVLR